MNIIVTRMLNNGSKYAGSINPETLFISCFPYIPLEDIFAKSELEIAGGSVEPEPHIFVQSITTGGSKVNASYTNIHSEHSSVSFGRMYMQDSNAASGEFKFSG